VVEPAEAPRAAPLPSDGLFAGAISLRQADDGGHRVGTDAVLLAGAAPLENVASAVDLGAGVGAVGLLLARRSASLRVVLVERDPAAAALARANVMENGLAERVDVAELDVMAPAGAHGSGLPAARRADLVVSNPPWQVDGEGRVSPERRLAHVMPAGGLDTWVKVALALLAPRGRVVMIHRADALPALLAALDRRFGGIAVRPVQARDGEAAIRVLVLATKGSRAPFRLLAPLVLHEAGGAFTPIAAALHRGEAVLDWA
jgi:tRNA1(Val) A37 N6-methylase TrmN6